MPVKRSLKLDDYLEENSFDPSNITRKKSITTYSPTTGTRLMSPFCSPTSSKEQEHRSGSSNGKRQKLNHLNLTERKESMTENNDEFMILLSEVEKSSEEITEIMQNLSSIQALEGNRELENLIGISHAPCSLKREVERTKELHSLSQCNSHWTGTHCVSQAGLKLTILLPQPPKSWDYRITSS
ncbi:centromere protein R isoform X2 [Castor canadensis]|uniref:Centromere protein R isoform X2 n=1 Tax=Castor canadensis TaxID=51338 RepID=A0AC58N2W1_CASCN